MAKARHEAVRTCVGCRLEASKGRLIRVVRRPDGGVAPDPTGQAPGRGAYLHDDPSCVEMARKRRALERALHTTLEPEFWAKLTATA